MKRATLMTIVVGLLLALTAGTTLAATNLIDCPNRPDGDCVGTTADDNIRGTGNAENIGAGEGDDQVRAFGGADDVTGGDGADDLYGDDGGDAMKGSLGNDYIVGGAGGDEIIGGGDNDRARGTDGNDTIRVNGDASNRDFVNCGADTDTAYVDSNDVVDDTLAETIVVNTATTCERLFVNGILIPIRP